MLLQPHQKSWKEDFNSIEAILKSTLSGIEISVEHIGSTAVPNLAAKPIIDIDVVFYAAADFDKIKERLERIGYYHNGNQGIENREVFKRNLSVEQHPILDKIAHHLYVCPDHSEELKRHLIFRDVLIQNEVARQEYEAIKCKIAVAADQDKKRYAQLKEDWAKDFILRILELAKK